MSLKISIRFYISKIKSSLSMIQYIPLGLYLKQIKGGIIWDLR